MDRITEQRDNLMKEIVSEIKKAANESDGRIILGLDIEILVPNHNINTQDEYSRYVPVYCTVKGDDLEVECYVKDHWYDEFTVTVSGTRYDYFSMVLANYIYDHIKEKRQNR